MRETEYNKLSETDKKKHADIVTILSQANGQATLTLETLLTRASDASTDTWIDRLGDTTYEKLSESFRDENEDKDWGPKDLEEALDKEYEDNAKRLCRLRMTQSFVLEAISGSKINGRAAASPVRRACPAGRGSRRRRRVSVSGCAGARRGGRCPSYERPSFPRTARVPA